MKMFFAGLYLFCITAGIAAGQQNDWENPLVNGIDRQTAAYVGLYSMDINSFITPYIKPQENGNRTDVRWIRFTGSNGTGFSVAGKDLLNISAWPWTSEQLENAGHPNELPSNNFITVNVDLKQMGVGGNDSWTQRAFPLKQYQISPGKYSYSFKINPVNTK